MNWWDVWDWAGSLPPPVDALSLTAWGIGVSEGYGRITTAEASARLSAAGCTTAQRQYYTRGKQIAQ